MWNYGIVPPSQFQILEAILPQVGIGDEDDGDDDDYDRHLPKYVLVICGTNTGQHMFVPASALCNDININVDTGSTVLTR